MQGNKKSAKYSLTLQKISEKIRQSILLQAEFAWQAHFAYPIGRLFCLKEEDLPRFQNIWLVFEPSQKQAKIVLNLCKPSLYQAKKSAIGVRKMF